MEFFTAPSLVTRRGKILCALIGPLYWSIAFTILEGEEFDPAAGKGGQQDRGMKRLLRGFFAKARYVNAWHLLHPAALYQ